MNIATENKAEPELDTEWMELIKEALELGLTVNQIRDFINNS